MSLTAELRERLAADESEDTILEALKGRRREAKWALRDDEEWGWSWDGDWTPLTPAERRILRKIRLG